MIDSHIKEMEIFDDFIIKQRLELLLISYRNRVTTTIGLITFIIYLVATIIYVTHKDSIHKLYYLLFELFYIYNLLIIQIITSYFYKKKVKELDEIINFIKLRYKENQDKI